MQRFQNFVLLVAFLFGVGVLPTAESSAQLYEQEPHDLITLNAANNNQVYKVAPLTEFNPRVTPRTLPERGSFRVRLLAEPDKEFEVSWSAVEKIELFEDRILQDAIEQFKQRKFDTTFEYLSYLNRNYPRTRGLDSVMEQFLFTEASTLYSQKEFERAWFLLDELYQRAPDRNGVSTALGKVLNQIFVSHLRNENYPAARRIYQVAVTRYQPQQRPLVQSCEKRLAGIAGQKLAQANQFFQKEDFDQAYQTARQVMEIWPETPGADTFFQKITSAYPMVTVGVTQSAVKNAEGNTNSWAARRVARLLHRRVFEIQNVGPEGGEYACPVGSLTLNQEATEAVIAVAQDATNIGGFTVARSLLASLAVDSSEYDPVFAAFVDNVSVKDVFNVDVRLRRPYLRIESLFAVPIRGAETQAMTPYGWQEDGNTADRFIVNKAYSFGQKQQPREITERLFSETRLAVDAFRRGEIDMIDRVFPADVAQLARDDSMVVDSYRIPSTHMLIPNFERPFPGTRAFRAAIAYGIDREQILNREILGGQKIEGCRVISGPFSPGVRPDDPLGYAYDLRIEPRPYEPRLSKLRLQLAQIEINATAEKAKEDPPKLGELVIVHPADEIARIACAEIVRYLAPLGLTCKLEELSPGADRPEHNDWDFLYTELVIHEPIADAGRLFAADGFAKIPSAYVNLALLQLQRVRNWNEAGQRLRSIHQVCFDEVAVIPLWQLVDHFAYRAGLQGVTRRPVNLYQEVEKWRISTN